MWIFRVEDAYGDHLTTITAIIKTTLVPKSSFESNYEGDVNNNSISNKKNSNCVSVTLNYSYWRFIDINHFSMG